MLEKGTETAEEVQFAFVDKDNQLCFFNGAFARRIIERHKLEFITITGEVARRVGDLFRKGANGACILRVSDVHQLAPEIQAFLNSLRFSPRTREKKFARHID